MEGIAIWVATALAAKMFAEVLRRRYGFATPGRVASAGRTIEVDVVYLLSFAAGLLLVLYIGLHAGLAVAIVLRLGAIVADRVLLPANHAFLELYLALVCFRLHPDPVALASVLQVMTISVWLYAVYQKLYQREFLDGSFFYVTMQEKPRPPGRWAARFVATVPAIRDYYGPIDPAARTFCRRLAAAVLVTETVPPVLAFAASGTIWSALLLAAVSLPVGLVTSETNFMVTNILLAAVFIVPFSAEAFFSGLADPIVAGVVGWCFVWPPVHAFLSRNLRFSPWRLGGWGMYSRQEARTDIVLPDGELRRLRDVKMPTRMLREFGACRIGWVRDAIRRHFFRWDYPFPAQGVVFRWYVRRGDRYVTSCVVLENAPGTAARTFEISDERSTMEFMHHISSLSSQASQPAPAPTAAVPA